VWGKTRSRCGVVNPAATGNRKLFETESPFFDMSLGQVIAYAGKVLPGGTWQALRPRRSGVRHLIVALADHFEPAISPEGGQKRVSREEQELRLDRWRQEYPKVADHWRDSDGCPFVHTYFYPAEQYDQGLLEILVDHCHSGWGEIEIHLHHGMTGPDTAENTRRLLSEFRDQLASRHRCLAIDEKSEQPRYGFVHGNFALANSAAGRFCGVDSEMQILSETGCYADFTLPTATRHPSQTAKMNALYECALPLEQRAPQRKGIDLCSGRAPKTFPLIVQGPLLIDVKRSLEMRRLVIENGAITGPNPLSLDRLQRWKQANIHVHGRPDWLFMKLHCHSMDPSQAEAVIGTAFQRFLQELVSGAPARQDILHFVTTREMTNIALAACDGKDGNPGDYRDYRFKPIRRQGTPLNKSEASVGARG
jgi:hypothetical protein